MTASTTGPLPAIGPTEAEWDRFAFELLQSAGSAGITDQAVDQAMLRFREWFVIAEFVGLWRAGMVRVLWRTKTQDLAVRAVARPCPERQNNSGSIRAEPLNEEWGVITGETTGNIPPIPEVHPNGTCFCGCGETTRPGKFFVITHDRRAEARVIRERFGDIATFVVWAERYLPKR